MSLPYYKSQDQSLTLLQTAWASQINPVLANPLMGGVLQKNVKLMSGTNSVNTKLGRALQGYLVTAMYDNFAQIYTTTSLNPSLTLNLISSADVQLIFTVFEEIWPIM